MNKKTCFDALSVGQKIREERERFKLSREEFAEIIGLSDYYVGQLERGERQMSLGVLVKIAGCLHLSLDFLIFGEKNNLAYYAHDNQGDYLASDPDTLKEIQLLLNKCSSHELLLIEKLLKTLLPYLNTQQK